uniref:Uncharacterized protein n=2 Tax=Picea TaxID=3328 RepID=A0A124GMK7_PICGL|nr:hypothetical protein ABT39_MTgene2055 [Picea glauca]QHR92753.1 hypothetical protein Q903MT_gene6801 [Picea sitchensis]
MPILYLTPLLQLYTDLQLDIKLNQLNQLGKLLQLRLDGLKLALELS